MKVLIIGGAGMIGRKLAERLAKDGALKARPITEMTLYDVVPPSVPDGATMPVKTLTGDLPSVGEAERLDPAHFTVQRRRPTPIVDHHVGPLRDLNGVGR